MKRVFRKITSVVLIMFLSIMCIRTTVFADTISQSEQNEEFTFVLVMDQTSSMPKNDLNKYYQTAAQMFIDMLPVENARAGVIGFGHEFEDAYSMQSDLQMNVDSHKNWAHVITPITECTTENRQSIKDDITNIAWSGYSNTVIDAGMFAGVDMLAGSSTPAGQGCIILMTDGDYSVESQNSPSPSLNKAVEYARKNDWPIYTVELDYAASESDRNTNHSYLTSEITDRMNGMKSEVFQISSADGIYDLASAFMKIINSYYLPNGGDPVDLPIPESGRVEYDFTIDALTAEENITVAGFEITGVMLTSEDGDCAVFGTIDDQTTSYNENEYEFSNSGQTYYNIKMILPKAGKWTLTVDAKAATTAVFNPLPIGDPQVSFEIHMPEGCTDGISKEASFSATATIEYHNQRITQKSLGDAVAQLYYRNVDTGEVKELEHAFEWNDESKEFEANVQAAELGKAGTYEIWSTVSYTKNGESKTITCEDTPESITTINYPVTAVEGASISDSSHYVREDFEYPIEGLFENPDNDILYFETVLDSGADTGISVTMNEDNTALVIHTGDLSSVDDAPYTGELKVYDIDMGLENACSIPISLSVMNHKMTTNSISDINMLSMYIDNPEGNDGKYTATVELNFEDEDQETINYQVSLTTEDSSDPDKILAYDFIDTNMLQLTSLSKGKVTVTVSAPDDDGKVMSEPFTVKTTTKADIRSERIKRFVRNLSVGSIVAIVAIILAIALIGIIAANIKIRGIWIVTIEASGSTHQFDMNTKTDVLGKFIRKGKLPDVISLNDIIPDNDAVSKAQDVSNKFGTIIISGILKGNGCKIKATNPSLAKLLLNGCEERKCTLSYGEAEIIVENDAGENIKIVLEIQ